MIYYFADSFIHAKIIRKVIPFDGCNMLSSPAMTPKGISPEKARGYCRLFMDSGGFGLIKRGETATVQSYIEYLKKYFLSKESPVFPGGIIIASLDVGNSETDLQNYLALRKAGIQVLPIFHVYDWESAKHRDLLSFYIKESKYVLAGGMLFGVDSKTKERFLNYVFSKTGTAVKIHGFGVGKIDLMFRYPFYSIDNSTWCILSHFGKMFWKDDRNCRLGFSFSNKQGEIQAERDSLDNLRNRRLPLGLSKNIPLIKGYYENALTITEYWKKRGVTWDE